MKSFIFLIVIAIVLSVDTPDSVVEAGGKKAKPPGTPHTNSLPKKPPVPLLVEPNQPPGEKKHDDIVHGPRAGCEGEKKGSPECQEVERRRNAEDRIGRLKKKSY
jgi:hypothetical protein